MFDEQKAEQITERIGQGIPVSQVARELQIGRRTIHDWREANPTFAAQFARAKLDGFDAIADEIIPIADDADPKAVDHARLRVDARLKLLAKWDAARYGDQLNVKHSGGVTFAVNVIAPTLATIAPKPALEHDADRGE
jgi:hypothetical protein